MAHAIRLLQREHARMSELLDLTDAILEEMQSAGTGDYGLLGGISAYLSGFPEQVHHPKEDLIYRRLRKLDNEPDDGPGILVHEHEKLRALTARLVVSVDAAMQSPGVWHDKLLADTRELVDYYRHHIAMEEEHFFPRALERLRDRDWAYVTYAISEQVDPLFDEATVRFENLRGEILSRFQSRAHAEPTGTEQQLLTDEVSRLENIEEFNALVEPVSPGTRLTRTEQGFALICRDSLVFQICDVGETTAIWCAHGFVQGMKCGED